MTTATILLPGQEVPQSLVPRSKKSTLTLGPGLRHIPPSAILSTTAGSLYVDHKRSALWLEHQYGRYQPAVGDLVIAQVQRSAAETYLCSLTPHTTPALLGQLAFEGANKKSRPQLKSGDLVYGRVVKASKFEDTEIECLNSSTGKSEGMGQLHGGMVFDISPLFARRLMMGPKKGGVGVLEDVGEKVRFEVAVGRNGRVWVNSSSIRETMMIGKLLKEVDEAESPLEEQKKLVKRAMKDV